MTYKLEEPWSDVGLLERILAYEEQAVRVLTRQVQAVPGLHTLPGISLETRLCQTKSRWNGPSVPIRLAEQKKVPRGYFSSFELDVLFQGKQLAEACPDGIMGLFSAFAPLVCTTVDEVLWYDYETDFLPELAELSRRIAGTSPNAVI